MPTYPAFYASCQERWDGVFTVPVWSAGGVPNRNMFGKHSHVMQPAGGAHGLFDPVTHESLEEGGEFGNWGGKWPGRSAWGWLNPGIDTYGPANDNVDRGAKIALWFSSDGGEGAGWTVGSFWFRPQIPRGATVSSATLKLTALNSTSGVNRRLRVFAIAEDDAYPPRILEIFTRATYMNRFFPAHQPPALRHAEESWEDSREHTVASVVWSAPLVAGAVSTIGDLSPIIQEIVDRPGWKPGNRLALLITGYDATPEEPIDGTAEFLGVVGQVPVADLPKLELVW